MLRPILTVLGSILLLAAGGKLSLLLTDPFADFATGYPFATLWIAVVIEISLFVALFTHTSVALLWVAYFLFFGILMVVSGSRWLLAFESCNCFGLHYLPVWATPLFNLLAIGTLFGVTPRSLSLKTDIRACANRLKAFFGQPKNTGYLTGTGAAVLIAVGLVMPDTGATWLTRDRSLEDHRLFIPDLVIDEERSLRVRLTNVSESDAKVIGKATSCGCVIIKERNLVLESNSATEIEILVIPRSLGRWQQRVVFFLDHPTQYQLLVDLSGVVSKRKEGKNEY